ncbi:class II 3-deoxy-7-phosphoheptulonate synthase [Candidatus Riflebacteria bacterium]
MNKTPGAESQWDPQSWRKFHASQNPDWENQGKLEKALKILALQPPLIFAGETRNLKKKIAAAQRGEAFLLQGGDCAEEFTSCTAQSIRDKLKILLQMAAILTYGACKPIVKVARIAGQYGKPRSAKTEVINNQEMPVYRGDIFNSKEPDLKLRQPDPMRLVRAYHQSSATLNLLRAFCSGGYASLGQVHHWNMEFIKSSSMGKAYEEIAQKIEKCLKFFQACGINISTQPDFQTVKVYTSHEALFLDYEEKLTRCDSLTNDWYDCSGHFLWIGERTRQLDGAHIEFFRGINNPIGIKIGPGCTPEEIEFYLKTLNPKKEWGRLVIITRFGCKAIEKKLVEIINVVRKSDCPVLFVCDPMHGNTYLNADGLKTRSFHDILEEIKIFFKIHYNCGTVPGGVHFEMTHADVTECIGGSADVSASELNSKYRSACDPRLNGHQSLELAFLLAQILET